MTTFNTGAMVLVVRGGGNNFIFRKQFVIVDAVDDIQRPTGTVSELTDASV